MSLEKLNYSPFPQVTKKNYSIFKKFDWDNIEAKIEQELGLKGIAIPSVRVGICWILEYLGYKRSEKHILVPEYLSRCILNAINRYALPVENITDKTSCVLVVDQFGFRQNIEAVEKEILKRNLIYIEDNANSISSGEQIGPNSLGKLIGLSKLLPVLKGGLFISSNNNLLNFIKKKRQERKPAGYSWFIFVILAWLRCKRTQIKYSALADLAYEVYLESSHDNRLLLNNFWLGLDVVGQYTKLIQERLKLINGILENRVIYPEVDKLMHVVLMFPENKKFELRQVFYKNGFDCGLYHFDVNRNIFNPNYKEVFLIPLNPTISQQILENLLKEISLT